MKLLATGVTPLQLTELAPGDEATVQAVFDGLTREQRLDRFHVAMPRLPLGMRRQLADVDGHHRVGLVVLDDGSPIALGRYARVEEHAAEVALEVTAGHTGRGIGSALLDALFAHAAAAGGIEHFIFDITGTNRPMLRLARSRGATLVHRHGTVRGIAPVVQPRPWRRTA